MARKRMEGTALKSWDEVNLNLKEICECELELESIEGEMNTKIQDLKLDAEMKAKPIQERVARLAQEVKEFTELNRDDIKGKSRNLNFGKVGFRQSTKILVRSAKAVINALRLRKMDDCIVVKESVNKERLREYPDEVIASVGARKTVQDVFWYETDREKLIP
ncbi:host-nuclease inhibitor Gam family protein [Desulfotruncus alcoholivorax]|uniref:host-nuclease inhibitor Gam family protein n=1 Tax=Desulfotruncus alcoholivorax TaxID=265477 RepID=UPI00041380A6|nr:host-nuclease inhibitor Gam family protein [Desulfotruncus alcoholivorax]